LGIPEFEANNPHAIGVNSIGVATNDDRSNFHELYTLAFFTTINYYVILAEI
jgi:hypothetical protein